MREGSRAAGALSPALIIMVVAAALLFAAVTNDAGDEEPTLPEVATGLTPEAAQGVEAVRGLAFDEVPEPQVISAGDLSRLNASELERPAVRERLLAEETVAKLLGLIEFDDDVLAVAEESGDLAAAAYDPRTDELYVIEDAVGVSPALIEFVLSHELNHALEDQEFDLSEELGAGDRALASTALVEGTATVAMIRYARRFQNTLALAFATSGMDSGTEGVPPFVLDQLLFAYTAGARFVRVLYEESGNWKIVNRALRSDPPVSSEQIIHPQKYLAGEGPAEIRTAGDAGRTGTLGEFATREMLGGDGDAALAAAGWGADGWRLVGPEDAECNTEAQCRRTFGLIVDWRWDSVTDANQFRTALPGFMDELGATRTATGWILPGALATAIAGGRNTKLIFTPR